jgi:hypothetical protein
LRAGTSSNLNLPRQGKKAHEFGRMAKFQSPFACLAASGSLAGGYQ